LSLLGGARNLRHATGFVRVCLCNDGTHVRIVIFGLTLSSAWANGHATPWRGMLRALARMGHQTTFFEQDVPYYREHRDLPQPEFCELVLYDAWDGQRARSAVQSADVAVVTSYCPDGLAACKVVLDTPGPLHVFYDLDTPVTLGALDHDGLAVPNGAHYLRAELIPDFDLYLSFTGGGILDELRDRWGARRVAPLYGSVDPEVHAPVRHPPEELRCALGYLGTYAADRQAGLEQLLIEPARRRPDLRFAVIGSLYPDEIAWPANVARRWHLDPAEHAAFYSASRLSLNVTRASMARHGFAPSGRLFEAAACGSPLLSDWWPGLDAFFQPGEEILVARSTEDALAALALSDAELKRIAQSARERTLEQHTGECRARELLAACEGVFSPC
jgi:spore maturation protein CgeB